MKLISSGIPEADAYGSVIISPEGKILLREPKDHFGGYAWTYAKGRPDPGETPEQAALRKVLEETGLKCHILSAIPILFPGTTTSTAFFFMVVDREPGQFTCKTGAICWATEEEARALIGRSLSDVGRLRDLDILDAALTLWRADRDENPNSYDPFNRHKLFEMVAVLHGRGYEKLRIGPHDTPVPYRLAVLPSKYFSVHHGAWVPRAGDWHALTHSSKPGDLAFGWLDAANDSPEQLADKYILRFPEEAADGFGSDPAYAAWFQTLLAHVGRGGLPMTAIESLDYGPYGSPTLPIVYYTPHFTVDLSLPLPPPGENDNDSPPQSWTPNSGVYMAEEFAYQLNYLGSPVIASALVLEIIELSHAHFKGEINFQSAWEHVWVEVSCLTVRPEVVGYSLDHVWHHPDGIGRALLKYFQLRSKDDLADDMAHLWTEALMALFLKTRDLLNTYGADPLATWDEQFPPQIGAFHDWAVSVILGTNVVFHSNRVIDDFL